MTPCERAAQLNERLGGLDRALGLRLLSASSERVEAELVIAEHHRQTFGLVHGGVYTSIVETLGSIGAWLAGGTTTVVGVDNHTSFLRAVKEGTLRATATPVHDGRRTKLWEVQIKDEQGRLVATGRLLAMCLDELPASTNVEGRE
jgi:1,4-dihydroxy-2-naphthoyl-CoA hydrolase